MHRLTLSQMSRSLQKKEFSSVELTQHYLNRVQQFGDTLNCYITVTQDHALTQAKHADQHRQQGIHHPLLGIPMAHKDIFCTKDIKTTCASKMLDNFISPYDATIVSRLNKAGMVVLGKTNMDEFAMGSFNENSFYGPVKNPWHLDYTPGGSSGGSAAAVAAHLTPFATGSDTGGSIRQPASLTGITGLKPTYGRVSRYGMIAYASSFDQAGIMCKTAEDAALILETMAGFDPMDSTSTKQDVPSYSKQLDTSLAGLKIGLPKQYFGNELDPQVADTVMTAIKQLEEQGAELVGIDLPNMHMAVPAYYVITPAECSSNLSRFDGVRFGYRCDNPKDLMDLYTRSRSEGFGSEVKRRIMLGTYVLSQGYFDAYYKKAQKIRRIITEDFRAALKQVDIIAGPTSPHAGYPLTSKETYHATKYLADIYTVSVNLAGLPALSIPAGFVEGLPVGLQLIGNYFAESRLLNVAHQYQLITDWHNRLPEGF